MDKKMDLSKRYKKLNEKDRLVELNRIVDWECFRNTLNAVRKKKRKSAAGRPPYDVVLMFKVLVLQDLNNLSDDEIEHQIRDRFSFSRFLGLSLEEDTPDAKTIWLFREDLKKHDLMKLLFDNFNDQLNENGYQAKKGQIIDASFVEVPKQRNTREENAEIKSGQVPKQFLENHNVLAQKDLDARWAKKRDETHFGYKDHIVIDSANKFIRDYYITSAEVHDSNLFIDLLSENTAADVWADSAYYSEAHEWILETLEHRSHVNKKAFRNKELSDRDKKANHTKSKIRVRVEHVFGSMANEQGGLVSRVIGSARTHVKIGMKNLVYNIRRFVTLERKTVLA